MTKSSCCKRGSVFNIRISGGKFWKTFHAGSILLHFPIILYDSIKLTLSWLLLLSWALCPKGLLLFVYPHFNLCFRVIYKASSMKPVSRSIDGNFKEKKTWKWRTDWIFINFRKFNNGKFHKGLLFSGSGRPYFFRSVSFSPIFWSSLWHLNCSVTKNAIAKKLRL